MAAPGSFRILGFPVTVQPGFILGILLIAGLNAAWPEFALRLGVALAAFTLLHELGHALAARRCGADAAISLNFLVGYAMFRPRRPLRRSEQMGISAAGPLLEIGVGVALLLALGANPLDHASVQGDPLRLAIWWAGPALGVLNLVPLLPLDGGAIAASVADVVVPGRGRRIVVIWTAAACAAMLAAVALSPAWRPWAFMVVLFSLWAFQALRAELRPASPNRDANMAKALTAAKAAEDESWRTGRPGLFPPGVNASPWFRAYALWRAGREASARTLLLEALDHGSGTWLPPVAATPEQLRPLVELLPADPPVDDLRTGVTLQSAFMRTGHLREAAVYGGRLYDAHHHPAVAHQVACAMAQLGEAEMAMGWLRTAHADASDPGPLDTDPDLATLRGRPDFQALRASVAARRAA